MTEAERLKMQSSLLKRLVEDDEVLADVTARALEADTRFARGITWRENEAERDRCRRAEIAKMPRIRFRGLDRDWRWGGPMWVLGVYWSKNPDAEEGECVYRKSIELRWMWSFPRLEVRR